MLIEIPSEEISNFVQVLEKELPESLFIVNYIKTCHSWKQKNDQFRVSLLYTERSMETGVFVGILKSGVLGTFLSMYAFDNYENELENALKQVQVDWDNISNFEGVVEKHVPIVEKLIYERCLKIKQKFPLVLICMSEKQALRIDLQCPDDVVLAPLSLHHADEMHKTWQANDIYLVDGLKNAIRYNEESAYGVFCKKSGELLASCTRSHSGVVSALQTVEKARKKGYAKLLLRCVAKNMAQRDIQKFIDESEHGVIYFSMGSLLKPETIPGSKRAAFLEVFRKLPQRIIWKWKGDLPDKTDEIFTAEWMPQRDILAHSKIKLFISHGGALGLNEAIHEAVPVLGIPMFADQILNLRGLKTQGAAEILPYPDIDNDTVLAKITQVLEPSYSINMKKVSEIFKDRPVSAMDTSIYWIEYVIRHRGAHHLRSAAADLPLYQYLLLDVTVFLFVVAMSAIVFIYYVLKIFLINFIHRKPLLDSKKKA